MLTDWRAASDVEEVVGATRYGSGAPIALQDLSPRDLLNPALHFALSAPPRRVVPLPGP